MANSPVLSERRDMQDRLPPLEESGFAHVGDEARRYPRYAFRGRAPVIVYPPPSRPGLAPQTSEVLTTDLSRSGVSLLHRKALVPGQRLRLLLREAERLVEVCWCCRVWPGLYAAGCRFVTEAAEGE